MIFGCSLLPKKLVTGKQNNNKHICKLIDYLFQSGSKSLNLGEELMF